MLEGKSVNLRIMEKEDTPLMAKWMNDLAFIGEFLIVPQRSLSDFEKGFNERSSDSATFIIEDKEGKEAGWIVHFLTRFGGGASSTELGYGVAPDTRGKGYCSEAVAIMLDYLFLLKNIHRIQALTFEENKPSKRVLEKNGFTKEGVIRKLAYYRNRWWDCILYSILKDEWGSPKVIQ